MSLQKPFDTYGFDKGLLDVGHLQHGLKHFRAHQEPYADGWFYTELHTGSARIYRVDPPDADTYPSLAIKVFDKPAQAQREFDVLDALYDFGFAIGPRPFFAQDNLLITEWLHGDPLVQLPSLTNEDQWHRIMALLGVPWSLPFAKFSSKIAMHGSAPQSPADLFRWLDDQLAQLPPTHKDGETLSRLVENVKTRVQPTWDPPSIVTLNHLDPLSHHFIWDGAHLRLVGWDKADWADKAFAVGQLCAHPAYLDVPATHWVWYRWELARLNRDQALKARATTYTNMMHVYWAVRQTAEIASKEKQPDAQLSQLHQQRNSYLQKAQHAFE